MRRLFSAIVLAGIVTGSAGAQRGEGYSEARDATIDVADAKSVRVDAKSGFLRIEGKPGLSEVRVRGTARASQEDWLDDIQLRTERRGDEISVVAEIPSWNWNGRGNAFKSLDLVIEMPARLPVNITDGSGEIDVRSVAGAQIEDGSGEIELRDIAGPVEIDDGSGEVKLISIAGDVRIKDGSGEVNIEDVRGNVIILDDGSGSLEITKVTGEVRVNEAGSGSVRVSDVGGDLTVRDTSRSRIRYDNVRGEVRIN